MDAEVDMKTFYYTFDGVYWYHCRAFDYDNLPFNVRNFSKTVFELLSTGAGIYQKCVEVPFKAGQFYVTKEHMTWLALIAEDGNEPVSTGW